MADERCCPNMASKPFLSKFVIGCSKGRSVFTLKYSQEHLTAAAIIPAEILRRK
jgi:hypothetical protein